MCGIYSTVSKCSSFARVNILVMIINISATVCKVFFKCSFCLCLNMLIVIFNTSSTITEVFLIYMREHVYGEIHNIYNLVIKARHYCA